MAKSDASKRRRRVVAGQRKLTRERGLESPTAAVPSPPPPAAWAGSPPAVEHEAEAPALPAAAEPAAEAAEAAEARSRRWRIPRPRRPAPGRGVLGSPVAIVAVLGVMVVLLAALGGLLFYKWNDGKAVAEAKKDSVIAARTAITNALSYNYRTFDADVARAQAYLADVKGVGNFRTDYLKTTATTVKDAAIRNKATVKAEVVYAGAIKASPSSATVLLFVDQTATNTALKAPRIDRNRIRVELRKIDGKWLVAKLTPI